MKETGPTAGSCEQVVAKDSNIIGTRVTTAKVESSNTMIRNIKKILAGSAPPNNHQSHMLQKRCRPDGGVSPYQRVVIHHET